MSSDPEIRRLRETYRRYATDRETRQRWDPDNAGNTLIRRERGEAIRSILRSERFWPLSAVRILEVGCGTGAVLADFVEWGADEHAVAGVDVVGDRLRVARVHNPSLSFVEADGAALPFADKAFGLGVLFTVFSSVKDLRMAAGIAAEIDRVLEPGGGVLWYDYRVSHPLNRQTHGVGRRSIRRLFPTYAVQLQSLTVVPQIARRLGRAAAPLYGWLARVPVLRTHYLALLRKPVV